MEPIHIVLIAVGGALVGIPIIYFGMKHEMQMKKMKQEKRLEKRRMDIELEKAKISAQVPEMQVCRFCKSNFPVTESRCLSCGASPR